MGGEMNCRENHLEQALESNDALMGEVAALRLPPRARRARLNALWREWESQAKEGG
jgi:hypothetical protein